MVESEKQFILQGEYHILNCISATIIQIMYDDDFTVRFLNDSGCRLFGYTREEFDCLEHKKALDFVYEPDKKYAQDFINSLVQTGEPINYQQRIIRKDGSLVWTKGTGVAFNDVLGAYALVTFVDISNMKRLEGELELKSSQMEAIYNHINVGIVKCDLVSDSPALFVNNRALEILGFTKEQFEEEYGNSIYKLVKASGQEIVKMSAAALCISKLPISFEIKLKERGGEYIWINGFGVAVEDPRALHAGLFTIQDITYEKKVQKELMQTNDSLRISERRYQIAIRESEMIVFEYIPTANRIIHASSATSKLGMPNDFDNAPEFLIEMGMVYDEDISVFRELFVRMSHNEKSASSVLRLYDANRSLTWVEITMYRISNDYGVSLTVIGIIKDVTQNKMNELRLLEKANTDSLTGLYNKAVTRSLIENFLQGVGKSSRHTFFIIDIDNFKGVNDNLGHIFGDAVLIEVSGAIKKLFRPDDIIGRIGGDEFVVFLKDFSDKAYIDKKAREICSVFRKTFVGEEQSYKISGSIGVCVYDGQSYEDLYRCADTALYVAKNSGKDRYAIYDPTMKDISETYDYGTNAKAIESSDIMSFSKDILAYVFDVLYNAKDIKSSVGLILSMLGQRFGVDRVYIFESSDDKRILTNTYEWCAKGINPMTDELRNIEWDATGFSLDRFDKGNIFYCEDVNTLDPLSAAFFKSRNTVSMLHVAITDNGVIRALIGFDECGEKRAFTPEEMDTLNLVGRIIGLFVLKKQIAGEKVQALNNNRAILDSMQNFVYVINPKTWQLVYINKKTEELVPTARLGTSCYNAFFGGRATPCEVCPVKGLADGKSYTMEVHNKVLNVWTEATASKVPWVNTDGCILLCCNDITRHKVALTNQGV